MIDTYIYIQPRQDLGLVVFHLSLIRKSVSPNFVEQCVGNGTCEGVKHGGRKVQELCY